MEEENRRKYEEKIREEILASGDLERIEKLLQREKEKQILTIRDLNLTISERDEAKQEEEKRGLELIVRQKNPEEEERERYDLYNKINFDIVTELTSRSILQEEITQKLKLLQVFTKVSGEFKLLDLKIKAIDPLVDRLEKILRDQESQSRELKEVEKYFTKEIQVPEPPNPPPSNSILPGDIPIDPIAEPHLTPDQSRENLDTLILPDEDSEEKRLELLTKNQKYEELMKCLKNLLISSWSKYLEGEKREKKGEKRDRGLKLLDEEIIPIQEDIDITEEALGSYKEYKIYRY